MDRRPVEVSRRLRYEAFIRILDLIAYAAVIAGGCFAVIGTPGTIAAELAGFEWLVYLWASLMLGGGAAGFLGRLLRYWFPEAPATWLGFFGWLIYFVVLGRHAFTSIGAAVATCAVLVAMVLLVRRWAELQIFATDPDAHDLRTRVADALRRRTQNFVPRKN